MKISILIPTKNRLPILRETLHNIYSVNKLPKEDFEVIVSKDGEEDLLILNDEFTFDNLKIIQNNQKEGLSGNRNNAIELSQYEILQFLDDDILITEKFLMNVITVHKKFDNNILCGNRYYPLSLIEIAEKTPFGRYNLYYEYDWLDGFMINEIDDGLYEVKSLAGFSISMNRVTFDIVRVFDENFVFAGCVDAEFFFRASQKNVKLLFDEKNICYHNELDNFTLDTWLRRHITGIRCAVVGC